MADEEIGSMLNRVRLSEDENGHLDNSCEIANDDLDLLDETFIATTQSLAGDMIAGNQEHYETIANVASQVEGHNDHAAGDLEANNNVTNNASQMEGHNAIGVGEIAYETVQPLPTTVREMASAGNMEHVDGLPGLMSDRLVEIPLALGLDAIE
ncbi:hypothetical protein SLEP1_g56840 [Rubroshorea leprosula]|uniref:Late embryogenesis abundant protein n=1 Tax=Rubroshorea leprosula TaxID=152421 RepID=A0AAV5MKZ1_9ROSI|nr:hypothetical protein SLEP1_g56840 [Rubroshorea leprosula]